MTRTERELELAKLPTGELYDRCRRAGIRTSPTRDDLIKLLLDHEDGALAHRPARRPRATKAQVAARTSAASS